MTVESYMKELNEAINFSKSINLQVPEEIVFDFNKRYFTESGNLKLISLYNHLFQSKMKSHLDIKTFALGMIANCSPFHHFLKSFVEKELGCKSYLTVGYILVDDKEGKTFHKITKEGIKESLQNEQLPDHHVWLTLDSGEILDMTFSISYQSIQDKNFDTKLNSGELEIDFINRHVNDFKHSMTYKPIIIGADFFSKIGWDLDKLSHLLYNKYID